jgi:hypothetical protein
MFYVALIALCVVNNWVAQRNVNEQPQPSAMLRTDLARGFESGV